ncbi:MAG: cofactor-independent phosphoglycerate mutase [Kiritimatiellae bacterium]|nr:cofactor-independent phosphoglycerate mutase [Kiritimatiellia bacterium]
MKVAVLVGDGMGDYPLDALGGRTPLQAARIPNMRRAAAAGTTCLITTAPAGMKPGSDVANLSLLGFDPKKYYAGRAPLEAAGQGLELAPADVAFRCNLVTIDGDTMRDYSAGHIGTPEASKLIEALNAALSGDGLCFHTGVSYRHLLVWDGGPTDLRTVPPHDILDQPIGPHLPEGQRQEEVRSLMERSREVLAGHAVNTARRSEGKSLATQIWLWGQGRAVRLPSYPERYGLHGVVISAVDLVKGVGRLAGLRVVAVNGATGFIDTNYAGKVQAALEALTRDDFVFLHVEAPDECAHLGDLDLKVQAIERFDEAVVGPMWQGLQKRGERYRLIVCTDHRTPIARRTHTREPVPAVVVNGPLPATRDEKPFDEFLDRPGPSRLAHEWMHEQLAVE